MLNLIRLMCAFALVLACVMGTIVYGIFYVSMPEHHVDMTFLAWVVGVCAFLGAATGAGAWAEEVAR